MSLVNNGMGVFGTKKQDWFILLVIDSQLVLFQLFIIEWTETLCVLIDQAHFQHTRPLDGPESPKRSGLRWFLIWLQSVLCCQQLVPPAICPWGYSCPLGAPVALLLSSSCLVMLIGAFPRQSRPLCTVPLPPSDSGLAKGSAHFCKIWVSVLLPLGGRTGILLRSVEINYFVRQQAEGLPVSGCKWVFDDVNNGNSRYFSPGSADWL